jgi:hypothetical protein
MTKEVHLDADADKLLNGSIKIITVGLGCEKLK